MVRTTVTLAAVGCLVAVAAPRAQQPPAQTPPVFRGGVEVASVDVTVVDGKGQPVGDLAPSDFVVTVAGRPRHVVSADFIDASGTSVGRAGDAGWLPLSTNERAGFGRLIVFVVDQSTLEPGDARQIAEAASQFFDRLTSADRSALIPMPVGSPVAFTADHDRVRRALQRVTGLAGALPDLHGLGLADTRAIASGDAFALRSIAERECRSTSAGGGGALPGVAGGPGATSPGGATGGGGGAGGGAGSAGGGAGAAGAGGGGTSGGSGRSGGGGGGGAAGGFGGFSAIDRCAQDVEFQAMSVWQQLHMTSLSSLASLSSILSRLKDVPGDKTVLLLSGGWPLEQREETSAITQLAGEAAEARVTFFTLFVTGAVASAERRTLLTAPLSDQLVRQWPLDRLAGMTGGLSFRVDVGASGVFDRMSRELSAYYRLGIEQDITDNDGRTRPMKVEVTRPGAKVRARERFIVRTYADRDATARLDAALTAPLPAAGLGLRLTSYVTADPDQPSLVRLVLVGDASRLQPGEATFELVMKDASGKTVARGTHSLGDASSDRLPFSTALSVVPGAYTIRAAVIDGGGTVGSVDHSVDARRTPVGTISAGGLVLARIPTVDGQEPSVALDEVRRDERLALQVDLDAHRDGLAGAGVVFEIAGSDVGPPLLTRAAQISGSDPALAQAVTDVRMLPEGRYVARARVTSAAGVVGEVRRPFILSGVPSAPPVTVGAPASTVPVRAAAAPMVARASASVPPFAIQQVLAPPLLDAFLDQLGARSDSASPSIRPLLDSYRTMHPGDIALPESLATEAPVVASFLTGVSRLARAELERAELESAASAFRMVLRSSSDFYPAMVYLGACYAAGGKDKEAAGAWQTALIKEGDVAALHLLLIDALLRMGNGNAAFDATERARARWPDDPVLKRRLVITAISAGRYAEGLAALDRLEPAQAEDEPALLLGLQVVYEALVTSQPLEGREADHARMLRYAEAYHRLNGPSAALVDAWVAAVTRKR